MPRSSLGLLAGLLLAGVSTPSLAACNPPGGMSIQQWYMVCGQSLQQDYSMGAGQGYSFDAFVQGMYQIYEIPPQQQGYSPVPQGMGGAPQGIMNCSLGDTKCQAGWVYTCESVGSGSMWKTGAQRCQ